MNPALCCGLTSPAIQQPFSRALDRCWEAPSSLQVGTHRPRDESCNLPQLQDPESRATCPQSKQKPVWGRWGFLRSSWEDRCLAAGAGSWCSLSPVVLKLLEHQNQLEALLKHLLSPFPLGFNTVVPLWGRRIGSSQVIHDTLRVTALTLQRTSSGTPQFTSSTFTPPLSGLLLFWSVSPNISGLALSISRSNVAGLPSPLPPGPFTPVAQRRTTSTTAR